MNKSIRFQAHTEELWSLGRTPVRGDTGDFQLEAGLTVTSGKEAASDEGINGPNK